MMVHPIKELVRCAGGRIETMNVANLPYFVVKDFLKKSEFDWMKNYKSDWRDYKQAIHPVFGFHYVKKDR